MEFHFYYPRKIDTIEPTIPIELARKRFRVKRVRIPIWQLKSFYSPYYGGHDKNGIYIFGKTTPKHLVHTINHEAIHYIIEKLIGKWVSTMLDNIPEENWNL